MEKKKRKIKLIFSILWVRLSTFLLRIEVINILIGFKRIDKIGC